MKKIFLAVLLLLSAYAWAGGTPRPNEYTVNVHVSSSSLDAGDHQVLEVIIDAKKYELRSELVINRLLALGDYKAKLSKNQHPTAYDSYQVYEFLFSDKTRSYVLVGQTE